MDANADSVKLVQTVRQEVEKVLDEVIDKCFGNFQELSE